MVDCVQPHPDTIMDPASGTGGFLLAAHEYIQDHHRGPAHARAVRAPGNGGITGVELVDGTARLAQMNLLLHGIGRANGPERITVRDALEEQPKRHATLVLANPPFGRKSGLTSVDENGRAAVVVPDNVLFQGGAGEEVRRRLLTQCDLHTMLRLPTGIFYADGVKANVLFFDKEQAGERPWTERFKSFSYQEIVDDLQAALSEFATVAEALQATKSGEVADPQRIETQQSAT